MRFLLFLILLSLTMPVTADMYKWVDKNGKTIYSDRPNPNGDEEKLQGAPLTTYKPDPVVKRRSGRSSSESNQSNRNKKRLKYSEFTIKQPSSDETFRQNAGNVTVKFAITPELNAKQGDKIELFLDGNKAGETSSHTYNFVSMDRGTHTLSANLVNRQGRVLKSYSVTFHLLRASLKSTFNTNI